MVILVTNADVELRQSGIANEYGENGAEAAYTIANANDLACQTRRQQSMLQVHYHRDSVIVRNPVNLTLWYGDATAERKGVLWLGRYDDFHKRAPLAMQVARACPEIPFTLVINRSDLALEAKLRSDVPSNVTLLDYIPYDQLPGVMRSAKVFLSTGHIQHEGFPYAILHAAASCTPIVSMYDFDDFIKDSGSGVVADDSVDKAANAIRDFYTSDRTDWVRVRTHLESHYSISQAVSTIDSILHSSQIEVTT